MDLAVGANGDEAAGRAARFTQAPLGAGAWTQHPVAPSGVLGMMLAVDFLIVGSGMFAAAIARHLAPQATVTLVGPQARAEASQGYGAHHDEGRIIGDLSRDMVWSELNRRARDGMTELDPAMITPCGALTGLLPGIRVRAWHTRRCADAYTAHRHPYVDILEPGRLTIALGGNGRGAQAADAVGQLTAGLALAGQWQSSLPRDAFRHVPRDGLWNGMTLLRDRAADDS